MLEGGEGNPFEEKNIRRSTVLIGDEYIRLLADLAGSIGGNTVVSAGTRLDNLHFLTTVLLLHMQNMNINICFSYY